jgi:uncharacterized membrane protein
MSGGQYLALAVLCVVVVASIGLRHRPAEHVRWPGRRRDQRAAESLRRLVALRTPLGVRVRADAAAYRFQESLFLLPALIVAAGVGAAELAGALDEAHVRPPLALGMTTNAATCLLATIADATITTAGVVFSLTVVSLQLASSQFSPRVLRSFIRDRLSQVVIGLLVATFCYSVLTRRRVDAAAHEAAPAVSMTVAVLLTLATVLLIVAHVDHLARRLQVVRVIANEGVHVLEATARAVRDGRAGPALPARPRTPALVVTAPRNGWVTQASARHLLNAVPAGSTVWLETRAGAYIHRGEALCNVWPIPHNTDAVAARVAAVVRVEDVRTMQQDVDFTVRQLVDIGLRALSPAVNDPTTAVEVVLRLGSLPRRLLSTDLPAEVVVGDRGRCLIRPWQLRHEAYIEHAFDQLRQHAGAQTQVLAALLRVLRMLIEHVRSVGLPQFEQPLRAQLELTLSAVRSNENLCASDRARLISIGRDPLDPADHSGEHDWTAAWTAAPSPQPRPSPPGQAEMASTTADGSTDKLRILALNLGTTMTRFCDVGVGQVVSHPTLLLRDRRGRPVAAGWNAWHLALHRPAHLRHPVRRGVVVNAHDCANMLRLLLAEEGLSHLDASRSHSPQSRRASTRRSWQPPSAPRPARPSCPCALLLLPPPRTAATTASSRHG